jgi:HEAT repeat protein
VIYAVVLATLALPIGGVLFCSRHSLPSEQTLGSGKSPAATESQGQDNVDSIRRLIASLHSTDGNVRSDAEHALVAVAHKSSVDRKLVVEEVLEDVRKQEELDGTHSVLETTFLYWRSVTNIFVELQASEALDVLTKCVDCGNGYSGNSDEPPAAYALVRMGKLAVPKLAAALLNEPNGYKRIKIAICLSRIGGPEAKASLRRALRSEKSKAVREYIQIALENNGHGSSKNHRRIR